MARSKRADSDGRPLVCSRCVARPLSVSHFTRPQRASGRGAPENRGADLEKDSGRKGPRRPDHPKSRRQTIALRNGSGARWTTLYAVYDSPHALAGLETALETDGKLESAGWTKIAPQVPEFKDAGELANLAPNGPNLEVKRLPPDFTAGLTATATEDAIIPDYSSEKSKPGISSSGSARRPPIALRVVRKGDGDGAVDEEVWSPEELVMETSLKARFGTGQPPNEIPAAAAEAAKKLNAHCTTFLAFRKSAMGLDFGPPSFRRFSGTAQGPQPDSTNFEDLRAQEPPPNLEHAAREQQNDLFERPPSKGYAGRANFQVKNKSNHL